MKNHLFWEHFPCFCVYISTEQHKEGPQLKRKQLALALVFALALTACAPSVSVPDDDSNTPSVSAPVSSKQPLLGGKVKPAAKPVYPKAIGFDDYASARDLRANYPVDEALWSSIDDFSARASALALGGTGENALFSPISLWFALTICAESADGSTRAALMDALGLPNEAAQSAKAVYNNLYKDNKIGKLKLSSSLWVNQAFPVKQDFLNLAAEHFYAHSYHCDFSDPATGKAMGDWLDEATGGLLGGESLETDPETLMTLFSAIYYSDQWNDEFRKENNTTDDFRNADGTISQTEYMNRTYGSHGWQVGDGWISSGLGLKNGGSMYFVLPDEGVSPGDLLADPETLAEIFAQNNDGGFGEVVFQIPKFEVSDKLDLKPVLEGMGAGIVFDYAQADFSNLSDAALGLSSVKQETTLSIDEKGVTAAAYTEILFCGAAPPNGRAELILDRPFLFFIKVSGVPLFVGVINQM